MLIPCTQSPYIIDDYLALVRRDPAITKKFIPPFLPSPFARGLRAMRSFVNLSCSTGIASLGLPSRVASARFSDLINGLAVIPGATRVYQDLFFKTRDEATGAESARPIDWDDLRIRPYSDAECRHNRLWTQLDSQVQLFRWSAANTQVRRPVPESSRWWLSHARTRRRIRSSGAWTSRCAICTRSHGRNG